MSVSAGYFMWTASENVSYPCAQHLACRGGSTNARDGFPDGDAFGNNSCAVGHTGVLCGTCKPNYYRGKRQCLPCDGVGEDAEMDSTTGMAIFLPLLFIAFFLGCSLYLNAFSIDINSTWTACYWRLKQVPLLREAMRRLERAYAKMLPLLPISTGLFKAILSYSQCTRRALTAPPEPMAACTAARHGTRLTADACAPPLLPTGLSAVDRFEQIRWPPVFVDPFMRALQVFDLELFAMVPME